MYRPTAHGTLVEIGYAKGRGIPVIVGTPTSSGAHVVRSGRGTDRGGRPDMWFALTAADAHIRASTAEAALEEAISVLKYWRGVDNGYYE
jgi:hypothetical protein